MVRRLTCALAALALTAGCGSQPAHTADKGTLQWSQCGDLPAQSADGLDCAVLPVPVDYAKPGGDRLELALVRHRATGSRKGC